MRRRNGLFWFAFFSFGCFCLMLGFATTSLLGGPQLLDDLVALVISPTATSRPTRTPTPTRRVAATSTVTPAAGPATIIPTPVAGNPSPTLRTVAGLALTATPISRPLNPTPSHTPTPLPPPTNTPLPTGNSDFPIVEFHSETLNQRMPFQIFLPPGYYDSDRRYAVVYMLHGWGGNFGEWGWYNINITADEMMRNGEIPPFIMVMPEGDKAYWLNHANNGPRWGDYVAQDVVNHIDANYRTLPKRESRAIGGLSMGALGAMQLALNHPNRFSIVGMHSPALRRIGDPDVPQFFGDQTYYARYDPFYLTEQGDAINRLSIYIDIGDRDPWMGRTQEFRAVLDKRQADYQWQIFEGEHSVAYFQKYPVEYLRFYGSKLAIR